MEKKQPEANEKINGCIKDTPDFIKGFLLQIPPLIT